MDQNLRNALIQKAVDLGFDTGDPRAPLPVVSLEDFFTGNDDPGSIGCNLLEHPGIERFHRLLTEVRDRDDVQDVFVQIHEVMPDDESMWPFADTVYVLSSASADTVAEWLDELDPDEVSEGWVNSGTHDRPPGSAAPQDGMTVHFVWWD